MLDMFRDDSDKSGGLGYRAMNAVRSALAPNSSPDLAASWCAAVGSWFSQ